MAKKKTTEQWIKEAKLIHGDKYNYDESIYLGVGEPIKIYCNHHKEFFIQKRANQHLTGSGCLKCGKENMQNKLTKTYESNEEWIKKAKKIHGDKYDYSKTNFINPKEKVTIICNNHIVPFEFNPRADSHINGTICPKCANELNSINQRSNTQNFINDAIKLHGNKYNYDLVDYSKNNINVKIKCNLHGTIFEQLPSHHLAGRGCPKCGKESQILSISLSKDEFISKAKLIHGDKYDYSEIIYNGTNYDVLNIICKKHDTIFKFNQNGGNHLAGRGCNICSGNIQLPIEDLIIKAKLIHGDKYDYSNSNYIIGNIVNIYCKSLDVDGNEHGYFEQRANNHLRGSGCVKCGEKFRISEAEVVEYIKSLGISNIVLNDRKILNGKELDIYIPELNIAIEFNGLYWHSDKYRDDNYHVEKTNKCLDKGIQLIHIFEDEWVYKQEIVKSRLRYILGKTTNIGYARKCFVKEIDSSIAKPFLENNHIQGFVSGSIYLGLYYPSEGKDYLLSVMTFGGLRKNTGNIPKENSYELLRFCNAKNYTVVGGANKLLKYFEVNYKPEFLLSYADRRWSVGSIYNVLNFVLSHISPPNYFYIKAQTRLNRWNYRKDLLIRNYGCSINDTERNFTKMNLGLNRIYDAGTLVFHKLYK